MAAGEFTKSFYELLDDMGGDQSTHALNALLDGLVRWMQGHELEEFVEDYRRTCEIKTSKELEEEWETNDFELCMVCQDTYHEDEEHICKN